MIERPVRKTQAAIALTGFLRESGGSTPVVAAAALNLAAGTVSTQLKAMWEAGMVERRRIASPSGRGRTYTYWLAAGHNAEKRFLQNEYGNRPVGHAVHAPGAKVYVIRFGSFSWYKIGVAQNPRKRLAALQTSAPEKLTLVRSVKCFDAFFVEQEAHVKFGRYRLRGEWFDLRSNELVRDLLAFLHAQAQPQVETAR